MEFLLIDPASLPSKFFDPHITITNPAGPVFDHTMQLLIGIGILSFLVLFGAAKLYQALRK